tara:strand:- start:390 stop:935 length:546 start_codon:yes stop_codon:yes gene_type:complete
MQEVKKFQNDFEQRFIHRINMQVKQAIKENEDFIYKQLIKVNTGKLEANKVMTSDEMNKKVLHMELQIMELKRQSNPYVLGVQVRDLSLKLERTNGEIKALKKRQDKIDTDSLLDTSITPEELKRMYASSGCTQTEMARFLNIDKSRFYQILNGKETNVDWSRRNGLKRYFQERISKNART